MSLTHLKLRHFTAFDDLDLALSPGINVFIGANGTGKTHILKVLYAACEASKPDRLLVEKLVSVFLPLDRHPGRLVRRQVGVDRCEVHVQRGKRRLGASFATNQSRPEQAELTGLRDWMGDAVRSIYIPVKEMLANAPGFRSLYSEREVHFEEVYADIIDRAFLPPLRGAPASDRAYLLELIGQSIKGRVVEENETFFLQGPGGKLEFTLLAEGMRKLGLLYRLIQNGVLTEGSILLWDEPEANLNPSMMGTVVDILLELQQMGVQVFLATHDYVTLKQFDLKARAEHQVRYHALYLDPQAGDARANSTDSYLDIDPNAISDAFADLYDAALQRALEVGRQ